MIFHVLFSSVEVADQMTSIKTISMKLEQKKLSEVRDGEFWSEIK